jgi:hypothetical protein
VKGQGGGGPFSRERHDPVPLDEMEVALVGDELDARDVLQRDGAVGCRAVFGSEHALANCGGRICSNRYLYARHNPPSQSSPMIYFGGLFVLSAAPIGFCAQISSVVDVVARLL